MSGAYVVQVTREALYLVLLVSAPPLLASLVAGLIVSVFQAATQLHDFSLSFVPKLALVLLSLLVAGPWIGAQVEQFARTLLLAIPTVH